MTLKEHEQISAIQLELQNQAVHMKPGAIGLGFHEVRWVLGGTWYMRTGPHRPASSSRQWTAEYRINRFHVRSFCSCEDKHRCVTARRVEYRYVTETRQPQVHIDWSVHLDIGQLITESIVLICEIFTIWVQLHPQRVLEQHWQV